MKTTMNQSALDSAKGEIVMYQPDETIRLEVRLEDETVWLTQQQISMLFMRERSVISKHIKNVFSEGELEEESNVHFLHNANSDKPIMLYSLDVIISVGYRVKSQNGTRFRKWANNIIKQYLLRGYTINQKMYDIEKRIDKQGADIAFLKEQVDFFVHSSLPPVEGIFYDGQIFDAYHFVSNLIRKATRSITLIDNYVDDSVLTLLDKRQTGVSATIFTQKIDQQLQLDINKHNTQYPPIKVELFKKAHDRFLLIDNEVYHIGASLKDLGKKWFAFTLLKDIRADELTRKMR